MNTKPKLHFMGGKGIKDILHRPENIRLHERVITQVVVKLTPIITKIVEQGIKERDQLNYFLSIGKLGKKSWLSPTFYK